MSLGGGGILGIAHILAIEAVDELGLHIESITGTSIGAIIGALRASGLTGREIRLLLLDLGGTRRKLARKIVGARALNLRFFRSSEGAWSPFDGRSLLGALLPAGLPADVDDLQIPFVAVATDLDAEQPRAFLSGGLVDVLAAASATPGLMRPVEIDGRFYVDGALLDPVPVRRLTPDAAPVVAVDLTGDPREANYRVKGRLSTTARAANIALRFVAAAQLARTAPALLLRPTVHPWRTTEFHRSREILAALEPFKDDCKRAIATMIENRGRGAYYTRRPLH